MKNIDLIKQKLEEYEKMIQRLNVLELELTSLNTEGLEPEANAIKSKPKEADKLKIMVTQSAESASSALDKGDYDNTANYATKSKEEIDLSIKRYKDALDQLNKSEFAIDNKKVDLPVEKSDELIKKAESELKVDNYEEATKLAKEAEEEAVPIKNDYTANKETSALISAAESEIKEICKRFGV